MLNSDSLAAAGLIAAGAGTALARSSSTGSVFLALGAAGFLGAGLLKA